MPNELLEQALREREKFLAEHPHLAEYQEEIDDILDKSGDHTGRIATLGTLMQGKLLEMQAELTKLVEVVRKATNA